MKNLAIIPARGGSKGVPRKNIKPFCGKPLISWSIQQAIASKCIDRIIVSTDDEEIASIARQLGAEVPFLRPASISTDTASTESAVLHCLDWLKEHEGFTPENIILIQATSPIRMPDTIDKAYNQFVDEKADSLVSVCEFRHFLWWRDQGKIEASYDYLNRPRRQDFKQNQLRYRENGSFYITKEKTFRKFENRCGDKISLYEMLEEESFEIDTVTDFKVCEVVGEEILRSQPDR